METQDFVTENGLTVEIWCCEICYALVPSSRLESHEEWHNALESRIKEARFRYNG